MKAWLTPDAPAPDKWYTRLVRIPASLDFYSAVSGALVQLTYPHNWEEYGDLTPEQTAAIFSTMYDFYCQDDNEPPKWETAAELDGAYKQPWYDELADWIIAGFLAITFTPQAAITYMSTVPKLRIAIRTNDIGALFRVLVNGVEIWTGDSYKAITDILSRDFDMSGYTTPYTVRIEHNGIGGGGGNRAKLEYIRESVVSDMVATILRADPTGCGVQWSQDNGGNWETIDLANCITSLANDAIVLAIADGVIKQPGNQPSPQPAPAPGQCASYHVALSARDTWLFPSPVNSGDVIHVTNLTGGWAPSPGLSSWYCPSGLQYQLGGCSGALSYDGSDPNPALPHMMLVGNINILFFDPSSSYTVPSGEVNQPLGFQANDSILTDNQGTIEFDVEVCTGQWCHRIDNSNGLGTLFVPFDGVYAAGVWSTNPNMHIAYASLPAMTLIEVDVEHTGTYDAANIIRLYSDNDQAYGHQLAASADGYILSGLNLVDPVDLLISIGGAGNSVQSVTLKGTGTNPFGTSNC